MTRSPGQPAALQPAVYKSLGLNALLQQLEGKTAYSVLDLGPACGVNITFWSQFGCKIYVEDLYRSVRPFLNEPPGEDGEPVAIPFPDLLPFSSEARFDVILAWDLFNYFHQKQLEALISYLARFCRAGTYLFALMSVLQQIPSDPYLYRILDSERMVYEARGSEMRVSPRYQPRDVNRLMTGFTVSSSFLLRHGVQEYVFVA
jgi:hypothetical protein